MFYGIPYRKIQLDNIEGRSSTQRPKQKKQCRSLHFPASLPPQLCQSHIYNSWQYPHLSTFLDSSDAFRTFFSLGQCIQGLQFYRGRSSIFPIGSCSSAVLPHHLVMTSSHMMNTDVESAATGHCFTYCTLLEASPVLINLCCSYATCYVGGW